MVPYIHFTLEELAKHIMDLPTKLLILNKSFEMEFQRCQYGINNRSHRQLSRDERQ